MPKARPIPVYQTHTRWGRCTIYGKTSSSCGANSWLLPFLVFVGAIGNCLARPVFMCATSTNKEDTVLFLQRVRDSLQAECRPVIVFDQHRAHLANITKAYMAQHFDALLLPR